MLFGVQVEQAQQSILARTQFQLFDSRRQYSLEIIKTFAVVVCVRGIFYLI